MRTIRYFSGPGALMVASIATPAQAQPQAETELANAAEESQGHGDEIVVTATRRGNSDTRL